MKGHPMESVELALIFSLFIYAFIQQTFIELCLGTCMEAEPQPKLSSFWNFLGTSSVLLWQGKVFQMYSR